MKQSISELIGRTPLLRLNQYEKFYSLKTKILAKLEYFNPAGSSKDRVALSMIEDAEKKGILKENSVIIEPTSGNTGIGLAAIGAAKGYRVVLTMPETMSEERRKLLKAYGAEIILTDGNAGMNGAIIKARSLAESIPNAFLPEQFSNPNNPDAHYRTTGPEIWMDSGGKIDGFIAGVGTGGTITGVGRYLKENNPSIRIVAVEPSNSALLSGSIAGIHNIQGIGAGFIPQNLDRNVLDEIYPVQEEDAYQECRILAQKEGILVGISSGAALYATRKIAERKENRGKTLVVLLPDGGDRYLSTPLFTE